MKVLSTIRLQIEDPKRILLLQGNKTSQVGKDVLTDLAKLKGSDAVKMSRKNPIWPFEPGHETSLQFFCERADCAIFCLSNHNNKRPHNLVLGRTFNGQLMDMLELGVEHHVPIAKCPGAIHVQVGIKV
jgi:ribosome production factor 2